MRLKIGAELDYYFPNPADVLLALEVAQMPDQKLIEDRLSVGTATPLTPIAGQQGVGQRTWTRGEGRFTLSYDATVDVERETPDLSGKRQPALSVLPAEAVQYLWPSRYCHSDKLKTFAVEQFERLEGGARVTAMADWTRRHISYEPGCSDASTTAHDTFHDGKGICRDFAHVMINFARALDIPARMVSAYAWNLDPPDFHAVVEVYLDGGWYLVDPSGLAPVEGLVRIAVGRDAADVSFMTVFEGSAELNGQNVRVERLG